MKKIIEKFFKLNENNTTIKQEFIAGFTTLSEKLDSKTLSDVLNEYLDGACKIIFKHERRSIILICLHKWSIIKENNDAI